MKLITFSLMIGLLISNTGSAIAQSNPPPYNLPPVVSPPADAASLGKYGSTPVDMSTGSANISIPLYEIKTPRLSLPISLNYNATGIKVDDIASWVGLEWSLNAGGVITRSIRGTDDFGNNGYYTTTVPADSNMIPQKVWSFFEDYMRHGQDSEPDYFFYNFAGYSGKFFFGTNKVPEIVNYQQPVKVQYNSSSQTFTIQDDKGNSYNFGVLESNATSGDYNGYINETPYISSWYLSSIVSFDHSDTISFSYFGDAMLEQDFESYTETIGPYYIDAAYNNVGHDYSTGEPYTRSYPWRLKEIDYKNGKLLLYSSARLDGASVKMDSMRVYNYDFSSHLYDLDKTIRLDYDYYYTNQTNEPSISKNPYRLRLDSVGIYGISNVFGGDYKFSYNATMLPWINSNGRDYFGYYNGIISNVTLVPAQNVPYNGNIYSVGSANRATDTSLIKAGILQSITYPTGGRTNFFYEANSYSASGTLTTITGGEAYASGSPSQIDTVVFTAPNNIYGNEAYLYINISGYNYPDVSTIPYASITDLTTGQLISSQMYPNPNIGSNSLTQIFLVSGHVYQCVAAAFGDYRVTSQIYVNWQQVDGALQTVYGGGLRLLQTVDYDYSGKFLQSNLYKYGVGECGYGFLASPVWLFNTNSYTMNFGYTDQNIDYGGMTNSPPHVTTREIFEGSSIYDAFSLSGAPVAYQQVTKYRVDSLNNNIGKSTFFYNYYQDQVVSASQSYLDGYCITNSGWASGQLLLNEEYANNGGTFWPLKRTYYSYLNPSQPQGRALKIGYHYVYQSPPPMDSLDMVTNFNVTYYWFDVPINAGSELLSTETTYDYAQNDSTKFVTTTQQFSYDNLVHLQPTTIVKSMSDGTIFTTVNRYPAEVDSISGLSPADTLAVATLQSLHSITTLVQAKTTRNTTPVTLIRYDFKINADGMDLPDSLEGQVGSNPMETRVLFNNYDNYGNLMQDEKASDAYHSYIWDYNNAYPIAEITNAASTDVAYTSFEANGTGNWTITDTTRKRTAAMTGNLSYNLTASNSISKSGLNSSNAYIVSYWEDSAANSIKVNGAVDTAKITIGSWTYYEKQVSGVTSVTISGIGTMDELRLYPKGSLMSTYTYTPMIGVTTQCDASGKIVYYTYDGLGRLKLIKDQYGNILKRYDYEYQAANQ